MELLTVIAIIGVLVALLLPAVQAARESARASACRNKLKQFGLALHFHLDVTRTFPALGRCPLQATHTSSTILSGGGAANQAVSAHVMLLPFIEQQWMYDRYRIGQLFTLTPAAAATTAYWLSLNPVLDHMRCPSDGEVNRNYSVNYASSTNYVFNIGDKYFALAGTSDDFYSADMSRMRGLFGSQTGLAPKDVTDGLSKTLAMSETALAARGSAQTGFSLLPAEDFWPANGLGAAISNDSNSPSNCWSRWRTDRFSNSSSLTLLPTFRGVGHQYLNTRPGHNGFTTVLPPNGPVCSSQTQTLILPPRSYHRGGVNCVMADGAVRFILDTIDSGDRTAIQKSRTTDGESPYGVWGKLGTRASGDVFNPDF